MPVFTSPHSQLTPASPRHLTSPNIHQSRYKKYNGYTVHRTVHAEGELEQAPLGGVRQASRHVRTEVSHGDTAHEVLPHLGQVVPVGHGGGRTVTNRDDKTSIEPALSEKINWWTPAMISESLPLTMPLTVNSLPLAKSTSEGTVVTPFLFCFIRFVDTLVSGVLFQSSYGSAYVVINDELDGFLH